MLSQTAEYALRTVLYLAQRESERELSGAGRGRGRVCVVDVAETLDIPRNYLSKTMNALTGAGILHSTRGPGGGFSLAVPADELTVAGVVEGFDPADSRSGCLLRGGPCDESDPCAAHHRWREVERTVRTFFARTTIADLLEDDGRARVRPLRAQPPEPTVARAIVPDSTPHEETLP